MQVIDNQGNIILLSENGVERYIGSLKNGVTYSTKVKARKVVRVTFQSSNNGLNDEFYFSLIEGKFEMIFQHIMNRDTQPALSKVYWDFFSENENYSPDEFILYVIKHFFVKELGYQFPEKN